MKRALVLSGGIAATFLLTVPAYGVKVADPTPGATFSDSSGNAGYIEVAADDGSGALVRGCNENEATPAGDDATGYLWVNPSGEGTTPTYGNEVVGAGDADGEDGTPPNDVDEDTNDDCAGNDNDPDPTP